MSAWSRFPLDTAARRTADRWRASIRSWGIVQRRTGRGRGGNRGKPPAGARFLGRMEAGWGAARNNAPVLGNGYFIDPERGRLTRSGQTLLQASVRTERRICSISSKCSWVQISGGARWVAGAPRADPRGAAGVGAPDEAGVEQRVRQEAARQPLRLVVVERLLGVLVLDELDAVEVAGAPDVADDRQVGELVQGRAEAGLVGPHVAGEGVPLA